MIIVNHYWTCQHQHIKFSVYDDDSLIALDASAYCQRLISYFLILGFSVHILHSVDGASRLVPFFFHVGTRRACTHIPIINDASRLIPFFFHVSARLAASWGTQLSAGQSNWPTIRPLSPSPLLWGRLYDCNLALSLIKFFISMVPRCSTIKFVEFSR